MRQQAEEGLRAWRDRRYEEALALLAETVRRNPADHRSRILAARSLAQLGEPERALTVLDETAQQLLRRDYLLTAVLAVKLAMRFNPRERRLRETLRRIHARALSSVGRAAVAPPEADTLAEAAVSGDLSGLRGGALADRAYEILLTPDGGAPADPNARPPLPLFADLDAEAFVDLVERMGFRELEEGETAVREGERGESLFVVVAGKLSIERAVPGAEPRHIAVLPGGSLFGELALLMDAPRTATIRALGDAELFEISRADITYVARQYPTVEESLAHFAERRVAANLLAFCPLFARLPQERRGEVLRSFHPKLVAEGERVIEESKPSPALFLIVSGEFSIQKRDPAGELVTLKLLRDGDIFGEISLVSGGAAMASVTAVRKSMVAVLPRTEYESLVEKFPAIEEFLIDLSQQRLGALEQSMKPAEVMDAEDLIVEE